MREKNKKVLNFAIWCWYDGEEKQKGIKLRDMVLVRRRRAD
jgi:hypothetical protein